jgi:hypothetical protein
VVRKTDLVIVLLVVVPSVKNFGPLPTIVALFDGHKRRLIYVRQVILTVRIHLLTNPSSPSEMMPKSPSIQRTETRGQLCISLAISARSRLFHTRMDRSDTSIRFVQNIALHKTCRRLTAQRKMKSVRTERDIPDSQLSITFQSYGMVTIYRRPLQITSSPPTVISVGCRRPIALATSSVYGQHRLGRKGMHERLGNSRR